MHPSHNGLVTRKSFPCHDVIISWVFFKVVITDLSEEDGVAAEIEFKAVYGEDHILFVKGDVTKQEDMEGMYIFICREGTAYITVTLQERHGISSHRQLNYFFNNLRHFRAMTSSRTACLHHTPWSFHSSYNTLDISRHYFSKNNSVKTHHSSPVTYDVMKWKNFRVTGHLCGESTGPRWIPHTKASDADLWCFLWSASE